MSIVVAAAVVAVVAAVAAAAAAVAAAVVAAVVAVAVAAVAVAVVIGETAILANVRMSITHQSLKRTVPRAFGTFLRAVGEHYRF